ncbi:MAG: HAMP domain-containing histidine kinase [Anaerolineae bacterium]|nr:HAMP domain-containing histidine kinase [Anaerolineae bacterium]
MRRCGAWATGCGRSDVMRMLFGARPLRAWFEAAGAGLLIWLVLILLQGNLTTGQQQNLAFIALLTGMTLYALRLRCEPVIWWHKVLFDLTIGFGAALLIGTLLFGLALAATGAVAAVPDEAGLMAVVSGVLVFDDRFVQHQNAGTLVPWTGFTMLLCGSIAFTVSRAGAHLWVFWRRLCRRRLIWALTHSHLMLVVLTVSLFALMNIFNLASYFVSRDQYSGALSSLVSFAINATTAMVGLGIFTVVLLTFILPPSIVLSYFAARRTTRRLEALAQATGTLRAGDYAARVDIRGEDEVAQLQADFNAMAEALEQSRRALEAERDAVQTALDSRRQLVASVSHELRTPVAILRSYAEQMLARREAGLPPDLKRDIEIMDQATQHLQRLIDDLFTLARAEVGELELRREAIDPAVVVRRSVEAFAPVMWRTGKVELIAHAPDALPPVIADPTRLEQILHNLLRNAARHTPPGGIVAVEARADAAQVVIEVKDTGEGIPPEDLPRIWQRFYRTEKVRAEGNDGAGLGLALVKELAEAMGGTVCVASTPGEGSCFTVGLPRA